MSVSLTVPPLDFLDLDDTPHQNEPDGQKNIFVWSAAPDIAKCSLLSSSANLDNFKR